jgi:hypothetical protein
LRQKAQREGLVLFVRFDLYSGGLQAATLLRESTGQHKGKEKYERMANSLGITFSEVHAGSCAIHASS